MHHPYSLDVEADAPRTIRLRVRGDVDITVAPELLDAILCASLSGDVDTVAIDLADVTFLDSSGLAAMIEAQRRIDPAVIRLSSPPDQVRRVLHVSGVDAYLHLDGDLQDGVAPA